LIGRISARYTAHATQARRIPRRVAPESQANHHAIVSKDGTAMKIQCQSCQAKYTIADEKVLGKVVKIRCKKCSATIVINGNETRPAEDNADTNVFDYAAQSSEQWTVNVADGDQRTMSPQEIANEYRAGVINDETYCWKDGMADWLPLREIEQLYGAAKLPGMRQPQASFDEISVPPQSVPAPAQAAGALFSSAEVANAVDSPFAPGHANGNGSGNGAGALFGGGGAAEVHAAPAAARRAGGRGQGGDLFGNAATAGGEEDVMTSAVPGAAAAGAAATQDDGKLTGQRNENSVLFSLNALTSTAKEEPKLGNQTTATGDGSGLIDIRALSATMGANDDKKDKGARVDDIMNLSGGGAFGAALAAPILAPPPLEAAFATGGGGDTNKSNKTLLIAILGAAALIAVGIVVAVVIVTRQPASGATADTSGTASAGPASSATGATVAANDTATATPGGAVTAPAAKDDTPPPPGTGAAAAPKKEPTTSSHSSSSGSHAAAKEPSTPKAPEPPPKSAPKDLNSALAGAVGKREEPSHSSNSGGSSAPFDRGAAAAALGGVNVQSCKRANGPTGSGHVRVTFAPNGSVTSASVDGGPFPGTSVGGCIAGRYRGAHIPAFSGGSVTVGKSFVVN
jgi:predicted Zn finger-like uncharacterized protein